MGAPPGGTLSFHRRCGSGPAARYTGRPELFGFSEQLRISYKLEVLTIDEQKQAPEIGTPEAAVQSCVNLLAKVTGIQEAKLAYYLDMYYQLRDAYEAAKAEERMEAMRLERAVMAACAKTPVYPDPPRTMNTPAALEDVKETPQSPASAPVTAPLAGEPSGTTDSEAPPTLPDAFSGFVPVEVKSTGASALAAEKRRIKDRLDRLRAAGVSVKWIVKAADDCITEDQIREIIDCQKMPIAVYRVLDGALNQLEGPALEAQQLP